MSEQQEFETKLLLKKVSDGYSKIAIGPKDAYLKHPTLSEEIELESIYFDFFGRAKSSGAMTKEETLAFLDQQNLWTKDREKKFHQKLAFIESLRKTKSKLIIHQQVEQIDATIAKEELAFFNEAMERNVHLGETCESYAAKKRDSYFARVLLFKDSRLCEKLFSDDEFEDLSDSDLARTNAAVNADRMSLSAQNLKAIVSDNFFYNVFSLVPIDAPWEFFGRKPLELTENQVSILLLAKTLRIVRENNHDIPEGVKGFDETMEFVQSGREKRKIVEKSKNSDGFGVVGASKEDMKSIGIDRTGSVSPFAMLKNSGKKSLGRNDFVKTR
jgi:hypothetical protein